PALQAPLRSPDDDIELWCREDTRHTNRDLVAAKAFDLAHVDVSISKCLNMQVDHVATVDCTGSRHACRNESASAQEAKRLGPTGSIADRSSQELSQKQVEIVRK